MTFPMCYSDLQLVDDFKKKLKKIKASMNKIIHGFPQLGMDCIHGVILQI